MIGRIKAAVKASMMQSKIEEYYYHLDEQFISYHDWITEREAAYRDSMQPAKKEVQVKVIELGESILCDNADILLFVTDKKWLDVNAVCAVADFF